MLKNPLVKISIAPFAVLILHIIATFAGWYEMWWWFDIPMHFLGGVAITLSSYYLLDYFTSRKQISIQFIPLQILILLGFAALAAVSWEFMEYAIDKFAGTNMQPNILDTIKDLAIGLCGGSLVAIITSLKPKK